MILVPCWETVQKAVKKREAPDYEMIIKEPMHLEKIGKRIASCFYTAKHDFIRDIQKMYDNCVAYNTPGTGGKYGHQGESIDRLRTEFSRRQHHLSDTQDNNTGGV